MKKVISLIILFSVFLISNPLFQDINESSYEQKLLNKALLGDGIAAEELGILLIYDKGMCEKGLYFLILSAESNPYAYLAIANLFNNDVCFTPSKKKYKKYLSIFEREVKSK